MVAQLQVTTATLQTSVKSLSEQNEALQKRIAVLEKKSQAPVANPDNGDVGHSADVVTPDGAEEVNQLIPPAQPALPGPSDTRGEQPVVQSTSTDRQDAPSTGNETTITSQVNDQQAQQSTPLTAVSADSDDTDGPFEQPRSERRRQQKMNKQGQQNLRAAVKNSSATKQVYIGNVDPKCSAKDVSDHLSSKGVAVSPTNVRQLGRGDVVKSFCVDVPQDKYDNVIAAGSTLLPNDLKVRPFYPKKKPQGSNTKQPRKTGNQMRPAPHPGPRRGHRAPHFYPNTRDNSPAPIYRQKYSREPRYAPEQDHYTHYYNRDLDNQGFDRDYDKDYDRDWPRLPGPRSPRYDYNYVHYD